MSVSTVSPTAAQSLREITFGHEYRADSFTWRFENPSSFDTAELVPHFFRQHYDGDNNWGLLRLRYGSARWRSETEIGATPQVTRYGDDVDTFFQPSGDVVTSGTTGNVSLRSLRLNHRMDAWTRGRVRVQVGYGYRRDRANFHRGFKSVTHALPPSREDTIVTTREMTTSEVHAVRLGAEGATGGSRWQVVWRAAAAPLTLGRFTVQLPDKYPGRDIRFWARVLSADTSIGIRRASGPLALEIAAGYGQTWSYKESERLDRRAFSVTTRVGWQR